jgi:iron(III) transport system substrate-binding protein
MKSTQCLVAVVLSAALSVSLWAADAVAPKTPLTVNWYHKAFVLQPVIDAFTAKTGIPVKVTDSYDTFETDVILASDFKVLTEGRKLGHFKEIKSPELDAIVPARWRDAHGYWYGVMVRARAVIYNKAQVKPDEIKTWSDLTNPKWKGRIAVRSASSVYNRSLLASMIVHNGEHAAMEWARGVWNNAGDPVVTSGDTGNIWRVAKGEYALSFVNTYYIGYVISRGEEKKNGIKLADAIGIAWMDQDRQGQHVNVTGVGIRGDTKQPEEAMQLVKYLLSQEGQALLSKHVFKYSVRSDVPLTDFLKTFGTFRADELNLNDLELHYDQVDAIYRAAGWNAW